MVKPLRYLYVNNFYQKCDLVFGDENMVILCKDL